MSRGELVRLRIKEFAARENWTLTEVAERSGVPYSTIKTYARSPGMAMVDIGALLKLARIFDVSVEDLFEVVEK
ncbi:helix-turn-helix transcriptional regulator [Microcoleus sp. FACHB-SPT15]|jgi:transcriptional regulator with XRE-family HTH domain|uniref:helix-turn-helix domain-containing protein n=1 Tax=Microcoleus sp. FACHB-SPT15 TaxID=2692830 RepID=UPI0017852C64|nr:helix-turn-helix transcriptional regulator [Microcoleus sp. FACHB-SPT15]MBD1805291.1 helix-turn-helix transcriptional regulator [Microcoleus sp. FACHB-SPT15]